MEMIDLPIKERSEYIRFLLTQLTEKYHVNLQGLCRDIGLSSQIAYRFMNGQTQSLSTKNLDRIESTVIDLYSPILEVELKLHDPFIQDLHTMALARKK